MATPALRLQAAPLRSVAQVAPPARLSIVARGMPLIPPPVARPPVSAAQPATRAAGAATRAAQPATRAAEPAVRAAGPATREAAVRPAAGSTAARSETRRPFHVPVAVGIVAGIYAGSLAVCSSLQFATDRQLIDDRRPVADAIAALGDHHQRMAAALQVATERYAEAASSYEATAADTERLRGQLEALARRLTAIDAIALDTSSLTGTARTSGSWTGGSTRSAGGGTSPGARSRSSGGASAPRVAPAPPPAAAAPPANASTGASGAP